MMTSDLWDSFIIPPIFSMLLIYHLMKGLQNIIILANSNFEQWPLNNIEVKWSKRV